MTCKCQSDRRAVALVAKDLPTAFPELRRLEGEDWAVDDDLAAVKVTLGSDRRFRTLADLAAFLRNALSSSQFTKVRAAWIEPDAALRDQLEALIHADPIADLAPLPSGPLLDILQRNGIETWYQPIFQADSREIWGYECLMRARSEDGEIIPPSRVLSWARQEDLLFMLDRICRETHLSNAGRVVSSDAHLLINFLPTTIYVPEFCLRTTALAAKRAGVQPDRVIFEVVETEQVVNRIDLRNILSHYRASGFGVALDDMGAGYAGLAMLADLDPDLIKLDRDMVRGAPGSAMYREICESIIKLAKEHGKLVLAEGVETEEEEDVVLSLGVDLLQGFRYGAPAPTPLASA